EQVELLVQDCVDLEQDILNRQKEITMPAVQVNKIVMEQRRWLAGKLLRSVYGDDEKVSVQNQQAVVITSEQLNDLRGRLDAARALYGKSKEVRSSAAVEAKKPT